MFKYFVEGYKNTFNYSGRATRSEYWFFLLANLLLFMVVGFLAGITADSALGIVFVIIYLVFAIANLLATISVSIRRLHDMGKSGWFYLLIFIPIVGPLVLLYFFVQPSVPDNQYGECKIIDYTKEPNEPVEETKEIKDNEDLVKMEEPEVSEKK